MKKAKRLFQYASNPNMSRGPDIAESTLQRFANGDLSKLKKFFFNAAIDVREIQEQAPFDKEIERASNGDLIAGSRSMGRICNIFDEEKESVLIQVYAQKQSSELQNSLLQMHSATLLAVTYAAVGVDMRGLIVLSHEDLISQMKSMDSASTAQGKLNESED